MFFHVLKTWLLLASLSTLCLAADISKPNCNAQTHGRMWPDAANHNPRMVVKLSKCGELEICSRSGWRYRWESLTVRIDQLRHGKNTVTAPAGCEGSAAEEIAESQLPASN